MAIRRHDQELLEQLYGEYGERYGGRREDYFPLLYLSRKFQTSPEEIAHQVAFGGSPSGIDAYYMDRATRNLYLYVFKWTEDHNAFKLPLERLVRDGLERILAPYSGSDQSDLLRYLRADLREYRALIERVYIRLVFKGEVESADNSAGLAERREALEDKKYLLDKYFNRSVELIIEFVADRPGVDVAPPRTDFTIPFTGHASLQTSDGQATMHLGFISLMDLYCMYQNLGQRFFDRNIRAGLDPDNPPNKKLREALQDIVLRQRQSPEVFAFNHNGVTLAAEQIEFGEGTATFHTPRLLNGAQTCISVARFLDENEGHETMTANHAALDAIHVLAKVVLAADREFITNVTICNNQQNPVEPWNLRANDRIQCDLQDKFREEVGLYYARQENAFENFSEGELEAIGVAEGRAIQMRTLAQTLLAIQGEIDRMSRLTDVFAGPRR